MLALAAAISTQPTGDADGWSPPPALIIAVCAVIVICIALRLALGGER